MIGRSPRARWISSGVVDVGRNVGDVGCDTSDGEVASIESVTGGP